MRVLLLLRESKMWNFKVKNFNFIVGIASCILAAELINLWAGLPILFFVVGFIYYVANQKITLAKAFEVISSHGKELAIKKRQLTSVGSYGLNETKKWEKEKSIFIAKIIEPVCGKMASSSSMYRKISGEIELVAARYGNDITENGFSSKMSPTEYEYFVASILRREQWSARVTKASGDQGVDVIAEKAGRVVVIQCKLYSHPVGNSAVQEVIAGRIFEGAQFAVVVTNNSYTASARQLASSAGVLLLHHEQIQDLEAKLIKLVI